MTVQMKDGTILDGNLLEGVRDGIPNWMQPGQAHTAQGCFAFIREETAGRHPEFNGHSVSILGFPHNHYYVDVNNLGVDFSKIHTEHNKHYEAIFFHPYDAKANYEIHHSIFPPINHVYIKTTGGSIYMASLSEIILSESTGKTFQEHKRKRRIEGPPTGPKFVRHS